MPEKEDNGGSAQADGSTFVLLVRGLSDRAPLVEEPQGSDCMFEPEDTLVADHTPPSAAQALVSDCEVEGTDARGRPFLSLFRNQRAYLAHSQMFPLSVPPCVQ
jgi:hypothetical protein